MENRTRNSLLTVVTLPYIDLSWACISPVWAPHQWSHTMMGRMHQ